MLSFIPLHTLASARRIFPKMVNYNAFHSYATDPLKAAAHDFRSDTFTVPNDEMLELMKHSSRGDDVYQEDESTNAFQNRMAELTGHEAALFCVSGTMTNQLAIRAHLTQPPHSVLCDARAHIHANEAGGIAHHSQATTTPVYPTNGLHLTLDDIKSNLILDNDIHNAPTKLVCLENTLYGTIIPQEVIVRIGEELQKHSIPFHLDGARIWDVSAKTLIPIKELCQPFDSVSLCMSKGLGAPIGSVLVGSKKLIEKARWFRKMFGGGVRQSGGLALAANYALNNNFTQLSKAHALAFKLAEGLHYLGLNVALPIHTGMIFLDNQQADGFSLQTMQERLEKDEGIRVWLGKYPRIVLHFQITEQVVERFIRKVAQVVSDSNIKILDASHPLRQQSFNCVYSNPLPKRETSEDNGEAIQTRRVYASYGK